MIALFKYYKKIGFPIIFFLIFFLVDPFQLGYLGGYMITLLIFIKKEVIQNLIDIDSLILLFFSVVYALFFTQTEEFSVQTFLFYMLFPTAFFLLGKYVVTKTERIKDLYLLVYLVGFLFSFTALLSVTINLIQGGFQQFDRTIALFW
ncbi:MAG: hypothetical protein WBM83_13570, partial [Flavobacteriaceae bacterium]